MSGLKGLQVGDRVEYTGEFSPELVRKKGTVATAPEAAWDGLLNVKVSWDGGKYPRSVYVSNVTLIEEEKEETVSFKEKVAKKALSMADQGNWCLSGVEEALKELGITQETIDKVQGDGWGPDPFLANPGAHLIAFLNDEPLYSFQRGSSFWEKVERIHKDVGTTHYNGRWADVTKFFHDMGWKRSEVTVMDLKTGKVIA